MIPDKTSAIGLFDKPIQYAIPIFQRGYVWTLEKQVAPLWFDLEDRANDWIVRQSLPPGHLAPLRKHFLGSVVLTPVSNAFGRVTSYEVIDGQQRTTTLHLLLLAFRHAAAELGDVQIAPMLDGLLRNPGPYTTASDHHKVWPTQAGRDEVEFLDHAADTTTVCEEFPARQGKQRRERPLMVQAYLYLRFAISAFLVGASLDDTVDGSGDGSLSDRLIHTIRHDNLPALPMDTRAPSMQRAEALYMVLQNAVQVMTLNLESDDDPQVIFETLNARGEPLLASDLIRNFIFLLVAREDSNSVENLYEKFWKDFDIEPGTGKHKTANCYWREKERAGRITHPRIDLFFFHYATLRSRQSVLVQHVFQSFKDWWQAEQRNIPVELQRIVNCAGFFRELISPKGYSSLDEFARLVRALDVSTLTPLYLLLRETYPSDDTRLLQALNDLASWLVRRAVCGLTTKNYNRIFLRTLEVLTKSGENAADVLRAHLLGLDGDSQRWPDDDELSRHWKQRPVYLDLRPGKTAAVLRALEVAALTKKQDIQSIFPIEHLTVEHVLPQKWRTTAPIPYPPPPSTDTEGAQRDRLLHSFGNLTLMTKSLNSAVSNGPFLDFPGTESVQKGKRTQICFESRLGMNAWFQQKQQWAEPDIEERAEALLKQALQLWPKPS